jgi:hypothetical protein
MNGYSPAPQYECECEWRWPWWKFDSNWCVPNALFTTVTTLHTRFNTRRFLIQDHRVRQHDSLFRRPRLPQTAQETSERLERLKASLVRQTKLERTLVDDDERTAQLAMMTTRWRLWPLQAHSAALFARIGCWRPDTHGIKTPIPPPTNVAVIPVAQSASHPSKARAGRGQREAPLLRPALGSGSRAVSGEGSERTG